MIRDFADDVDTLRIDDRVWGGGLSKAQVIDQFGKNVNGDAVLKFSASEKITIKGMALADLQNDLEIA